MLPLTRKRINIVPQEEVKKCLDEAIKNVVTFVARRRKCSMMAVTFVSEPEAIKYWDGKSSCWLGLSKLRGHSLEMFVEKAERGLKEMSETIKLPNGTKLAVMTEGRPPNCFPCGKKGQYVQETKGVDDMKQIGITNQEAKEKFTETSSRKRERRNSSRKKNVDS